MNLEDALAWVREFDKGTTDCFVRLEYILGEWSAEIVNTKEPCTPRLAIHGWSGYRDTIEEALTQLRATQ